MFNGKPPPQGIDPTTLPPSIDLVLYRLTTSLTASPALYGYERAFNRYCFPSHSGYLRSIAIKKINMIICSMSSEIHSWAKLDTGSIFICLSQFIICLSGICNFCCIICNLVVDITITGSLHTKEASNKDLLIKTYLFFVTTASHRLSQSIWLAGCEIFGFCEHFFWVLQMCSMS